MRTFSFSLAISIMVSLAACSGRATNNYEVNYPTTSQQNGLTAYILDYDTGEKIDSAIIDGNPLVMTGKVDEPRLVRLIVDGNRAGVFVLESGKIAVDTANKIGSGTPLNDRFVKYASAIDSLETAYDSLPLDSAGMAAREKVLADYKKLNETTLEENIDNPIGYYIFLQEAYEMDASEFAAKLEKMPQFAGYKRIAAMKDALARAAATAVGCKYADFEIEYDGKKSRLSDYVGKDGQYTLVDFWASWCGPCIKETRTIKRLYEKYGNGKGLNVVGVAVWDEPDNTLRAVEGFSLPWPQIINAGNIPTDLYGVSGIPCIFLIAPDGTIVSRGKQGDELVADVEAALKSAE